MTGYPGDPKALSDAALVAAFEDACVRLCEMDVREEVRVLRAELLARLAGRKP